MRNRVRFCNVKTASTQIEQEYQKSFGWVYTRMNGIWSIINEVFESGDILRVSVKSKKYRYRNMISQRFYGLKNLRYVGDIIGLRNAKKPVFSNC